MNKFFPFFLSFVFFLTGCVSEKKKNETFDICRTGEKTAGFTEVRDTIGGDIIFTLNEGICLELIPSDNPDWDEIAIIVEINDRELQRNEITAGAILKGKTKKEIGQMLLNQTIWDTNQEDQTNYGFLRGYIHHSDVDPETILENIISNSCQKKQGQLIADFEEVIDKYHFINYQLDSLIPKLDFSLEEYNELAGIVEFIVEDSWLSDPGSDRLSLIFRYDTLFAIVHKRAMNIPFGVKYELPDERSLILLNNSFPKVTDQLLKFKTEFYNSFYK